MNNNNIENFKKHLKHYINEFFEVFIALIIIKYAMDKTIKLKEIIPMSIGIGFVTFLLELYNPNIKNNVRNGMSFTVGTQLMSTLG